MSRPLIAVTATSEIIRNILRARLNAAYGDALATAGLLPLVAPPMRDPALAGELLDRVDGLVLSGGEDVDPGLYGARRHPATEPPHAARDAWELALIEAARERATPVLAICRGMQILNVALGGTLVQDLQTERPGPIPHVQSAARSQRVHAAAITDGSRLAAALGATVVTVNSSHHQAVDRIASTLRVAARSEDGIIEGIESVGDWWVVGAQWHPEELVDTPEPWDRNLFSAFAAEVHRTIGAPRSRSAGQRVAV